MNLSGNCKVKLPEILASGGGILRTVKKLEIQI